MALLLLLPFKPEMEALCTKLRTAAAYVPSPAAKHSTLVSLEGRHLSVYRRPGGQHCFVVHEEDAKGRGSSFIVTQRVMSNATDQTVANLAATVAGIEPLSADVAHGASLVDADPESVASARGAILASHKNRSALDVALEMFGQTRLPDVEVLLA